MSEDDTTLREMVEWFEGRIEDEEESFPGDLPDQGIESAVTTAAEYERIRKRAEVFEANEEEDTNGLDEQLRSAIEQQTLELLACIVTIADEWDFDIVRAFETQRAQVEALESAESMEELQEAISEAGMDIQVGHNQPGDDVSADDYDPDDLGRGFH